MKYTVNKNKEIKMKNKLPADVQTIIDYYDDNWLNYDFSNKKIGRASCRERV